MEPIAEQSAFERAVSCLPIGAQRNIRESAARGESASRDMHLQGWMAYAQWLTTQVDLRPEA